MTNWQVGMKAVCIHGGDWADLENGAKITGETDPLNGEIYTVTRVNVHIGDTYLFFAELHPQVGYVADEFRPVVDRKTDISIFHQILDQVSTGIHHDFEGEPDLPPPPSKQKVEP